MQKKERYRLFIDHFTEHFPEPNTELEYIDPFQLLIAVMLSAQCTDKRVNMVTPALYRAFPTPQHLAAASIDEVFPYIKSVTYPNSKTKHLIGMAQMLINDFNSKVPEAIEDLQKLPGVGRKTANVIVAVIYNQPAMPVDTHVFRVSRRIGLANSKSKTPLEVEKQLITNIPKEYITRAHHWLILHGRYVCRARKPKCDSCELTYFCRYFESTN
ncbi:endonuclease III [Bacteroidota bacterium]